MGVAVAATLALVGSALVAAPIAVAGTPSGSAVRAAPLPATQRLGSFDTQMVSLVNGARANAGAPPVTRSGGLSQLAVWWSTKMATGGTGYQLEHNPNAWTMVTQYGASNRRAWAENVASFPTSASAQAVFDAYMNSPGHRANILNGSYRYIGMGTVAGSKGAYNTMEFTDRVDGAPAESAPSAKPQPKPRTSTPEPAPTSTAEPAPTTRSMPSTSSQQAAGPAAGRETVPATADPPPQRTANEPKRPAPQRSHGTVRAAFGALPAPGITFSIRNGTCKDESTSGTTNRQGRAAVTTMPGAHCAVAVSVPHGVLAPKPIPFTVRPGQAFTVTVDEVQPVTVWWRMRGTWLKMPI